MPFAHKDEATRASAKSTSKQGLNNSKKAPHRKASPRKERNSHPRKERRTPSEPDPAGSSNPQTSYRTKNYDNTELNLQYIYRQS